MVQSLDTRGVAGFLTNSLHTQTSGAGLALKSAPAPWGFIRQTHSAFNRGWSPLHRSSPAGPSRAGPLLQVPSRNIRASDHALRRAH